MLVFKNSSDNSDTWPEVRSIVFCAAFSPIVLLCIGWEQYGVVLLALEFCIWISLFPKSELSIQYLRIWVGVSLGKLPNFSKTEYLFGILVWTDEIIYVNYLTKCLRNEHSVNGSHILACCFLCLEIHSLVWQVLTPHCSLISCAYLQNRASFLPHFSTPLCSQDTLCLLPP